MTPTSSELPRQDSRFRKRPVEIDAVQWTGGNVEDVRAFAGNGVGYHHSTTGTLYVETIEGTMRALPGDWIIRGVQGEYYPFKPDIFKATYESV